MMKFEMNGIAYTTDEETLNVLRSIMPSAKDNKDYWAVASVMTLGLKYGRIVELGVI